MLDLIIISILVATRTASVPSLHVVAYATRPNFALGVMGLSAEANGLVVETIGFGLGGEWGAATFTARLNSYDRYLSQVHLDGDDVVLFVDAFDTVFFGGEAEIVARFLKAERALAAANLLDAALLPSDKPLNAM